MDDVLHRIWVCFIAMGTRKEFICCRRKEEPFPEGPEPIIMCLDTVLTDWAA